MDALSPEQRAHKCSVNQKNQTPCHSHIPLKAWVMSALGCSSGLSLWFKVGHRAISLVLRGTRQGRKEPWGSCSTQARWALAASRGDSGKPGTSAPEGLLVRSHEIAPVLPPIYVFMEIIG